MTVLIKNISINFVNKSIKLMGNFASIPAILLLEDGTTFEGKSAGKIRIIAGKYKEAEGSIHKVAAKIMGAESYNGWTYWHCDIDGTTVVIDSLRQKFISEKQI